MNQKKCPKCGEMNPGEAVMCWACYTPLTGGAPVAAGGPAGALAQPNAANAAVAGSGDDKKAIAPWQIGVLAVALLVGLGFGVSTMMGGPAAETIPPIDTTGIPVTGGSGGGITSPGIVTAPAPSVGGGGDNITPAAAPFSVVTAPNPQLPWGIMAIVPSQANVGAAKAASLAAFAGRQFRRNSAWRAMQVYVFQDIQSAQAFKSHQTTRRQDVLGPSDYTALANVWPQCLARYEVNGRTENIKYPSRSPATWWR